MTGALMGCGLCTVNNTPPVTGARVSPILWSRSIGWYLAATVDVLEFLPYEHPDRAKLEAIVANIAEGLKTYQDPATALWFQIIDAMDGPVPAKAAIPARASRPSRTCARPRPAPCSFTLKRAAAPDLARPVP